MSLSMNQASILVFVRGLGALSGLLKKGLVHVEEGGIESFI